ncbi:DUF4190 domain-containing protein [Neobacillus sp. OS1-33]|jgi:hypothetical protein|uniref:DUF4190 domain-containing protein n=1 Tax=Neobacillus sp. OS1-33 TaxID=3070683 RepID=UPI0027E0E2E5|nr:DUF4190 domain-containing protein [Neobacillus sp. OS1-33]WML25569.1 DUF4190 domain-containing protein [Neobacillus sp. OS1-33]
MADERDTKVQEALRSSTIGQDIPNSPTSFREETSTELTEPIKAHYTLKKDESAPRIGDSVPIRSSQYKEETAAEIAAPVPLIRRREQSDEREKAAGGTGLGTLALVLSILSLFVMPILFGAAGIVLGFVARRRGANGLGAWAIGIGAISIVIGIFILPFF